MNQTADAPLGHRPDDHPSVASTHPFKQLLRRFLPAGSELPEEIWAPRHRGIVIMLYAHAAALAIFGLYMGWGPLLSVGEGALVALIALLASWKRLGRRFRASTAAFGAVMASAILVQFSGGYIEAHFHFFVMVAVIALYQDWVPFLVAVVFVALDHGVIGTLYPEWVYNHPAAVANPWHWAGIHAGLVLGQCVALLALWKSAENAQRRELNQKLEFDRVTRESGFKTHLLTNVSHELKTPLTPLQMNVQMLKRGRMGALDERQMRVVTLLDRNLERLVTLVDQTLDVSRLEAQRMDLDLKEVDLRRLAEEAIEDYKDYAEKRGVQVALEGPSRVMVEADPHRIAQVLHNLVSNAVKFSDTGDRVTVTLVKRDRDVRVHVHDTGRGLTEQERSRLFEPFVQVHDTSQMTDAGSGLGLYLSKGIIAQHEGQIWCESPGIGQGSTFSISLPLDRNPTGARPQGASSPGAVVSAP